METPLLQLTGVTKTFGAVRALHGVSFSLRAGEVHALLGENGAGKSTLIKVMTGAHPLDSGTLEVSGRRLERLTPAAAHALGIACVYQQPALFPDLSVAENIALRLEPPAPFRRVRWSRQRSRARELLARAGAEIDPDTATRELSMPEQQLVEIACALGAGARVVIMDEPTASLTQKEVELLYAVVCDLRSHGAGVVYISHRLEEIFALADRVTVLRDGESVGTYATETIDEAGLIKLMVGRAVNTLYPPVENEPGPAVLSLHQVGCRAAGIRDVNLEVRAGEVLGLAGLLGAGRTELARVIFGITPADTGTIALRGKPVRLRSPRDAARHRIACVPEDRRRHGIILEMAIAVNMTMAIHRRLFPGAWIRFGAERRLALEAMRDLAVRASGPEAPGASLSGGNQQKVALARWLVTDPQVLIFDEPTQGIDVGAKAEIHKLIRRLAGQGVAILMISSDLPEILGMSTRIAVMRGGTITGVLAGNADAHEVMAAALGQTGEAA
ncbi:MAG: sugar ABC transporter ATP-binding protein [Verrucomicrobiota bacterium]|nr:sugar ABC transporter ATP-binding protein [Verrucomicrobiota bacterium]